MVKRKTIKIDGSLCDGCASCIAACAEGAIELVDGKAMVVHHEFCDGLGACIGECPKGALTIVEREIKEFDESPRLPLCNATSSKQAHTASVREPGGFMQRLDQSLQLTSWPIQMRLKACPAGYGSDEDL